MRFRNLWIALAIAVPISLLVVWWLYTYEYVADEIDLPPRGEARYNPLYALKLSLQEQDVEVAATGDQGFDPEALGEAGLLLLYSDVRTISDAQAEALLDWVSDGGHLVFALPASDEGRTPELLSWLGIWSQAHESCLNWKLSQPVQNSSMVAEVLKKKTTDRAQLCFTQRFNADEETQAGFDWLWGNANNGYLFGRQSWGDGSVFIASDLGFLNNRNLDEPGRAALAWQILGPALSSGRAQLVYASNVPPMYVLIVRHGWPILLPAALALLAWLWFRNQRFGPLLPLAEANRRALLEHVEASGEFAYRRGRPMALYAAVHRRLMTQMKRRDPALAALDGEALVGALAARTGVAANAIRSSLQASDLARPESFTHAIRTLMQLRAKL